MRRWKDIRMDDRQRMALPVEALAAMGWGWDEALELSVSPAGNALLLRLSVGRAAAARGRREMAVRALL